MRTARTKLLSFGIWSTLLLAILCKQAQSAHYTSVQIGDTNIQAEIASTPKAQMLGLQHRTALAQNNGMLFVYPKPQKLDFWMKDTLIPLDLIWIDHKHHIMQVLHDVQPCKTDPCQVYSTAKPAQYVLEVNAGFAKKHKIKIGSEVNFI